MTRKLSIAGWRLTRFAIYIDIENKFIPGGVNVSHPVAILLIVVGGVFAVAIIFFLQKRRSEKLRKQFGPEYDRTIEKIGDKRRAEQELQSREKRVESFHIRDLKNEERIRFAEEWRIVQSRFVDEPSRAVEEADLLVRRVMEARGYPLGNFEQRVADISVNHPTVVQNYRSARDIAERNRKGSANTEDLRQAMVFYRALFDDLLTTPKSEVKETAKEKEVVR